MKSLVNTFIEHQWILFFFIRMALNTTKLLILNAFEMVACVHHKYIYLLSIAKPFSIKLAFTGYTIGLFWTTGNWSVENHNTGIWWSKFWCDRTVDRMVNSGFIQRIAFHWSWWNCCLLHAVESLSYDSNRHAVDDRYKSFSISEWKDLPNTTIVCS